MAWMVTPQPWACSSRVVASKVSMMMIRRRAGVSRRSTLPRSTLALSALSQITVEMSAKRKKQEAHTTYFNFKKQKSLHSIVNECSKIAGATLNNLPSIHKNRAIKKAWSILDDPSHPLDPEFILLTSDRRFVSKRCKTNRYKNSFIPTVNCLFSLLAAQQIAPLWIIKTP